MKGVEGREDRTSFLSALTALNVVSSGGNPALIAPSVAFVLSSRAPKSLQMVTAAVTLKDACFQKKSYDKPRKCFKKQRHYFANKGPSSQGYGFSSSHVWM